MFRVFLDNTKIILQCYKCVGLFKEAQDVYQTPKQEKTEVQGFQVFGVCVYE
jgi:hypothetical protein